MSTKTVKCIKTCYESNTGRFYEAGKVYEIDPANPIAVHFGLPKPAKDAKPSVPMTPPAIDPKTAGRTVKPEKGFLE